MLLRKRAWDIMREEFTVVDEDATLAKAIDILRNSIKDTPDAHFAIVRKKNGTYKGVVSIWSALRAMQDEVLEDEALEEVEGPEWDTAFAKACAVCTQTDLDGHMVKNVVEFRPNDPLMIVLDTFLKKKKSWAVVMEGERVLGTIFISDLYRELSGDMVKAF